tara:strand:- start:434 stop:1156 length:723 start_codon:yes stop_codon:yes gene_type:complete
MPSTSKHLVEYSDITLLGVDGVGNDRSILKALKYSMQFFPNAKVKFLTAGTHEPIDPRIEHIAIRNLNYDDFSKFSLQELHQYFDTKFMIYCHGDGFATSADPWCDAFLEFDYLGAPWPKYNLERSSSRWDLVKKAYYESNKTYCVGNGGFSLRTKKLMEEVSRLYKDEYYQIPEDLVIAIIMRKELETKGFQFTNHIPLASRFSCEAPFIDGYICSSDKSVGFHCGDTHPHKVKLLETV